MTLLKLAGAALGALLLGTASYAPPVGPPPEIAKHVEIIRTAYGVPHIRAENLEAGGYGLAYVMCEDYGTRVPLNLLRGRGETARFFGRDSIAGDFEGRLAYARAVAGWSTLDADTRAMYDGFAQGVNRWVEQHRKLMPDGFDVTFTGYDALATEVNVVTEARGARFAARLAGKPMPKVLVDEAKEGSDADEGSNAWALAPSRTTSKRAILLRNPHLRWDAGYYEAHLTVPNVVDFYGDFRIGSPFAVVGGFNRDLGFATTNNDPLLAHYYALDADTTRPDHYLLDGASLPLVREEVPIAYRDDAATSTETYGQWRTSLGPVVARANGRIYILRAAGDGDIRAGEQFLRMMRARSLAEYKDAMRMRARATSSFTYADRAGNIHYLWNGIVPALPHASGGDSLAAVAHRTSDVWTHYVPFDSLPQLLNPKSGYIHNENDPPMFTNVEQPLDSARYPFVTPVPRLGLRSQHAIALLDDGKRRSLEDVVRLKHSYRMLLAERTRDELVKLVRASSPAPDVGRAIETIAAWDGTVAPASRGGVLFETWWRRYVAGARADTMYAEPWSARHPTTTPRGIRVASRAIEAFVWAVGETTRRYGAVDVAWGDVHRVRLGTGPNAIDVPVGGCGGDIGCFRVLSYREDADGKRRAVVGDGWVLAVEFGADQPRAYSVLAYGESSADTAAHHSDQGAMFARGEMKRVAWLPGEVDAQAVRRYRPGADR